MRLVLTSSGIANKSIEDELRSIIGCDLNGLNMLFCTTASNYEGGDMNDWLIKDIETFKNLGFKIDICDINGIGIDNLLPRFEAADVLFFEGGNTQWLRKCIKDSGLESHLRRLLETRVWIGASAGSCVLCPTLCNSCQDLYDETLEGYPIDGLDIVDFQFMPHFNNEFFPSITRENIENASKDLKDEDGKKLYVVDDNGALFLNNDDFKIISEGEWFEI
ncbi:MAG: Type 1 glutamine amidotransferase-like domain-containing protein [Erysipelotrichales bacterium]|nr:Type 1 glutamine amidotransferase-like domain-containing protein [Erysipelotrichales bacterium]